jgi:hypothetical protein
LIPAIIFFPHINEYEAILMIGAERFVEYKGYADSFKVIKSFKDPVQTDK